MTNPVQLPDAAVEASAKHSYEYEGDRKGVIYIGWECESEQTREYWRESVRQVLTAALPHLPLGYEEKKLDWQEPTKETNGCWTAKTVFGTYSVVNESGWYAVLDDHAYGTGGFEWLSKDLSKDTRQTAFAAAQADFERRVRECLVGQLLGNPEQLKTVDAAAALNSAALIVEGRSTAINSDLITSLYTAFNGYEIAGIIANHDKELGAAIRALSAEPAQGDQWRDMKDAPRTGEEIIYLTKYGEIGFCKYTLAMNDDEDDLWWDFQSDADVYPNYWLPRTNLPAAPTPEAVK